MHKDVFDRRYGNVLAAKRSGYIEPLEHARFRDNDLSVKGAGLLGFAGLMLACDFVFLAASKDSFIEPAGGWAVVGLAGAFVLTVGAFCALYSIFLSDRHEVPFETEEERARPFLISAHELFERRRKWLQLGMIYTFVGATAYIAAIMISVLVSQF